MSLLSQIGSLLGSASSTSTTAAMAAAANATPFSQTLQQSINLQNNTAAQCQQAAGSAVLFIFFVCFLVVFGLFVLFV